MNEKALDILNENILGTLATVNQDGSPRSTPLHLITDGKSIYWFSSESTTHSLNIDRDSRVSLTLFSPDTSNGLKAVYFSVVCEKVSEGDIDLVRDLFKNRAGSFPQHFMSAAAYRLPIGSLDLEKSTGNCWYFYS